MTTHNAIGEQKKFTITYHLCDANRNQCSDSKTADHDSINEWIAEMEENQEVHNFFIEKVFNNKIKEFCF